MSQKEALKTISGIILDKNTRTITTDEINDLIKNAQSEEESLYVVLYNYMIAKKQKKVILDAKF